MHFVLLTESSYSFPSRSELLVLLGLLIKIGFTCAFFVLFRVPLIMAVVFVAYMLDFVNKFLSESHFPLNRVTITVTSKTKPNKQTNKNLMAFLKAMYVLTPRFLYFNLKAKRSILSFGPFVTILVHERTYFVILLIMKI